MSAIRRLFGNFRSSTGAAKSEAEQTSSIQWVVVGLGNPGQEYARSRHNAGFMTIDRIAKRYHIELNRRSFKAFSAEVKLAEKSTMLVKPQTFYNLSGECVSSLLGYFKIPPNRLIVVHDELDIEPGRLRIKQGGSDAGNRGVRSIAESLGTPDFIRVRIGIGRAQENDETKDYLLRFLTAAELHELGSNLDRAAAAIEALVESGLERAMNRFNQRI
jgi:peptidyl-tRNA hydrolase, PTH1 family